MKVDQMLYRLFGKNNYTDVSSSSHAHAQVLPDDIRVDYWKKHRSKHGITKLQWLWQNFHRLLYAGVAIVAISLVPALFLTTPEEPFFYSGGKTITVLSSNGDLRVVVDNVLFGNAQQIYSEGSPLAANDAPHKPEGVSNSLAAAVNTRESVDLPQALLRSVCVAEVGQQLSARCLRSPRASGSKWVSSVAQLREAFSQSGVSAREADIWITAIGMPSLIDRSNNRGVLVEYRLTPNVFTAGNSLAWVNVKPSHRAPKEAVITWYRDEGGAPRAVGASQSIVDASFAIDLDLSFSPSLLRALEQAAVPAEVKWQAVAYLLPRIGVGELGKARLRLIYESTALVEDSTSGERRDIVAGIASDTVYAAFDATQGAAFVYRWLEDSAAHSGCFDQDGISCRVQLLPHQIYRAPLTDTFRLRRHPVHGHMAMHRGIDLALPVGTPIHAAADGVVTFVGNREGYGGYIRIDHKDNISTAYAHLVRAVPGLDKGEQVRQGQIIGWSGESGVVTGPHLHYEVLVGGVQVDPVGRGNRLNVIRGANLEKFRQYRADFDNTVAQEVGDFKVMSN